GQSRAQIQNSGGAFAFGAVFAGTSVGQIYCPQFDVEKTTPGSVIAATINAALTDGTTTYGISNYSASIGDVWKTIRVYGTIATTTGNLQGRVFTSNSGATSDLLFRNVQMA